MKNSLFILLLLITNWAYTQTMLEGYVFESDNRGYLNMVKIELINATTKEKLQCFTDLDGRFEIALTPGQYSFTATKDLFFPYTKTINVANSKLFENIKLNRQPGYIFDVTLARVRDSADAPTDAIKGAWIEIYNNTTKEEVLNLKDYPHPNFQFTFTKGNYYTVMMRKKGYFTKRLEAHVDIDGCILCFEGIGDLRPGVTDNLTEGNEMGTLLANVEMIPAEPGDKITLRNIYYDYNSADIRSDAEIELNKLIPILRDNPDIIVELSSHTDSRGDNAYNQELSFRRAKNAVDYLVAIGGIEPRRIVAKGYGENQPVNRCVDGVDCTDEEYQENRRTELKVLGYLANDPLAHKTLVMIKEEEAMANLLKEVQNQNIIEVKEGEELPEEIRKQMGHPDVESGNSESEEKDLKTQTTETPDAQDIQRNLETEDEYEAEIPNHNNVNKVIEKANIIRSSTADTDSGFPKNISPDYTGYKIQIMVARNPIDPKHKFFIENPRVYIDKTKYGYAYLLGDFDSREAAEKHLNATVKSKYPDAFIIHFVQGERH